MNQDYKFISMNYPNATKVKFNNRRVIVEKTGENEYGICFKILCTKEDAITPSARHFVFKDKLKYTKVKCSEDAAIALFHALGTMLSKKQTK